MQLNLDISKRYTFADYLNWLDDQRRELINGFIKAMSPAPGKTHQQISSDLHGFFWNYLRHKPCNVFHAPFDVRLPLQGETADNAINTVVQPDICIICDEAKLDEKGCLGAPDMIIEIVSPTSAQTDVKDKYEIYQQSGVKEYWIVFPFEQIISVYLLKSSKYELRAMYTVNDSVPVALFNDALHIDLKEIFRSPSQY